VPWTLPNPASYEGREQTYVKHVFLDRYLERVALVTLASGGWTDFVFVDGYSGPWKAQGEASEDTSVSIALTKLRLVRQALQSIGKQTRTSALFIERNPNAFAELQKLLESFPDSNAKSINGEFHQHIDDVVKFIGSAFSLTFIDPTGWNIDLVALRPLLNGRGEVLINFMYDFVNRQVDNPDPNIQAQLTLTFGGEGWKQEIQDRIAAGSPRETAILDVFMLRLKMIGGYPHVTYTAILKPLSERTYFHLVYATRHWRGLDEFRKVEADAMEVQERVRFGVRQNVRAQRSGMDDMFAASAGDSELRRLEDRRLVNLGRARTEIASFLLSRRQFAAHEVWAVAMAIPLVAIKDAKRILIELVNVGRLRAELHGRQRVPGPDTIIHVV
jgi:three-Cys-motif partner protein